jgi:uncharacterized repeat protein (TIGR02543 family)
MPMETARKIERMDCPTCGKRLFDKEATIDLEAVLSGNTFPEEAFIEDVTILITFRKANVTNEAELNAALINPNITHIYINGTIGSEESYTIYTLDRDNVTIKGLNEAKVYGTFIITANGVTVDGLQIQNKGDVTGESTTNRAAIYVYAENVVITNNTITNGLGSNEGLSNAIQIMSSKESNPLSSYAITGNTITGHSQSVTTWSSSGIVIAQGFNPGSIGGARAQSITATAADYEALLTNNTLNNNKIDLTHQDWSNDGDEVVIYPLIVKHEVSFNSDGGSVVESQTINEGSKANRPVDPTKEGFDFLGWFIGENKFDFDTLITEAITLTAHWEEAEALAQAKTDKKAEFDTLLNTYEQADYSETNWAIIEGYITAAQADVDAKTVIGDVEAITTGSTKDLCDAVQTLEQEEAEALAQLVLDAIVNEWENKSFNMGTDAILPQTGDHDSTIAWTIPEGAIIEGKWSDVTADTTYSVTVVVTIDDVEVSEVFDITVKFVDDVPPVGGSFVETFDASSATRSYADGSFTGVNGVVWTFVHARDEENTPIDGKGIMLRRAAEKSSLSATFTNGIGEFSFEYRKAFTGANPRKYAVDVTHNGTTTTYVLPEFGSGSGAQDDIYEFTQALNLTGTVTIKIYATGSTSNQQATFDNFTWTTKPS